MGERVIVVGAGVCGLSSALALSEAGYEVRILAERLPQQTTSVVAAACWYPFHVGPYNPRWAERTYEWFNQLVDHPAAGVTRAPCREYFETPLTPQQVERDFWWRRLTGIDFQILPGPPKQGPKSYSSVVQFTVPIIRMEDHLKFLTDRLAARGVPIRQQRVEHLDDVTRSGVVVNCTALGSRQLCNDATLFPAQGQVVVVRNWGLAEMLFGTGDEAWPVYLIPRGRDVVLGGTYRPGESGEVPSDADSAEIRSRCAALDPRAADAEFLYSRVGLRPCRQTGPRVEAERRGDRVLIHNYGHAGGGVTLAWGCAEEVVRLVRKGLTI